MSDTDQDTKTNSSSDASAMDDTQPVMDDNIQVTQTTDNTGGDIPIPEIVDQNEISENDEIQMSKALSSEMTNDQKGEEERIAEGEKEVVQDIPEKEIAADEAELATESIESNDTNIEAGDSDGRDPDGSQANEMNRETAGGKSETGPADTEEEEGDASNKDSANEEDSADGNMLTSDNPEAAKGRWYVVHTFSGHENRVATTLKQRIESEHLENKIFDILVPTQDKIEIKSGKKETVKEKIFPGYILIKMILDDTSWLAVRTTQGVTAFIGTMNKPTPISEREVAGIVKFMNQGAAPTFKDVFMVDDTVKIIDGPFAEFIGKVDSVDKEEGRVRVLVSIFGRETPVELDFLQVQKL